MEEEKKEEVRIPKKRRGVALFRRRKKSGIRPFVQQKKHREYKKNITRALIVFLIIFALAAILFAIQKILIPSLISKNTSIISPQLSLPPNNIEVENILKESLSDISNIEFSTSSAVVIFRLRGNTIVYISREKDIKQQLSIVNAIDRQIMNDGKQAISIDLRYNKPIVKF